VPVSAAGPPGVPPDEAATSEDVAALERAATVLAAGAIVAIPTDTVYGLAVDPRRPGATDALFAVKLRPATLELPVLVASVDQADGLAGPDGLSSVARRLARRFWPGSLTIVVPRRGDVDWVLGGDGRTIGLRCPAHSFARRLCDRVGPLATTSANRHGEPPITSASGLGEEFGDEVALIVDGGVCDGAPSTVVDVTAATFRCIRDGAVPWNVIQEFVSSD
jgi:L-threonylcarbamoyladenylate synthase